jgi:hypothetical protein
MKLTGDAGFVVHIKNRMSTRAERSASDGRACAGRFLPSIIWEVNRPAVFAAKKIMKNLKF